MVPLIGLLLTFLDNLEAFVDDSRDHLATINSRVLLRAVEHKVEEVGTLIS